MEVTLEDALARLAVLEQQNQQLTHQLQAAAAAAAQPAPAPAPAAPVVKPPKPDNYKGGKGVITWLAKLEQYFEAVNLANDAARITYAALLLEGPASTWWTNLREAARANAALAPLPATWADFRTALCDRFQPVTEARLARQQLRKLVQTRGLQSYINEFQDLALKVPGMDEETKMDSFCFGLRPDCRQYVRQQDPCTLKDAIRFALRYQATMVEDRAAERALGSHWRKQERQTDRRDAPTPMELGSAVVDTQQKRQSDRADRRVFRCYACGQPGHRQSECPNRRAQRPPRSNDNRPQLRHMREASDDSEEEN